MEKNKWTQADLARHLGLSRARVTQVLNVLKIPKSEIVRIKNEGGRITERRLRNLKLVESGWADKDTGG